MKVYVVQYNWDGTPDEPSLHTNEKSAIDKIEELLSVDGDFRKAKENESLDDFMSDYQEWLLKNYDAGIVKCWELAVPHESQYLLFGEDAVSIYYEDGIDEVINQYENDVIGYGTMKIDLDTSIGDVLMQMNAWHNYVFITKEEYDKL